MRQSMLDRVLGIMQANKTVRRESKQIMTKGSLMDFRRVDRVSGWKDWRRRVRDVQHHCEGCGGIGHRILTASCPPPLRQDMQCLRLDQPLRQGLQGSSGSPPEEGGGQEPSKILYTSDAWIPTDETSSDEDGPRAEGPSGMLGTIRMV